MFLINKLLKSTFWLMVLFSRVIEGAEGVVGSKTRIETSETMEFELPQALVDLQIANALAEKLKIFEIEKLELLIKNISASLASLEAKAFSEIANSSTTYFRKLKVEAPVLKGYLSLENWIGILYAGPKSWPVRDHWKPMRASLISGLEGLKGQFEYLPVEINGLKLYNPALEQDLNQFLPSYSGKRLVDGSTEILSEENYLKFYGTNGLGELQTRALCWKFGGKNHSAAFRAHIGQLQSLLVTSRKKMGVADLGLKVDEVGLCVNCKVFSDLVKAILQVHEVFQSFLPDPSDAVRYCEEAEVWIEPIGEKAILFKDWPKLDKVFAQKFALIGKDTVAAEKALRGELSQEEQASRVKILQDFQIQRTSLLQAEQEAKQAASNKELERELQQRQAERKAKAEAARRDLEKEAEAQLERDKKREEAMRLQEELSPVLEKPGQVAVRYERLRKEDELKEMQAKREALLQKIETCKAIISSLKEDFKNYDKEGYKFKNFTKKPDQKPHIEYKIANEKNMLQQLELELKSQEVPEKSIAVVVEPVAIPEPFPADTVDGQVQAAAKADLRATQAQGRAERKKIRGEIAAKVQKFRGLVSALKELEVKDLLDWPTIEKWFECVEFYNKDLTPVASQLIQFGVQDDVAELYANLLEALLISEINYLLSVDYIFKSLTKPDRGLLSFLVKAPEELDALKTEMEAANKALQEAIDRKTSLEADNAAKIASLEGQIAELKEQVKAKEGEMAGILKAQPKVKARGAGSAISGTKSPAYNTANAQLIYLNDQLKDLQTERIKLIVASEVEALGKQISEFKSKFDDAKTEYTKAHNNSLFASFVLEKMSAFLPAEPSPSSSAGASAAADGLRKSKSKSRGRSRSKGRSSSPSQEVPGPVSESSASPAAILTGTVDDVPEPKAEEKLDPVTLEELGKLGWDWRTGGAKAVAGKPAAPAQPARRAPRVPVKTSAQASVAKAEPASSKPVVARPRRVGGGFSRRLPAQAVAADALSAAA